MFALLLIPAAVLIGAGYFHLFKYSHHISEKFRSQPAAVGFLVLSAFTSLPEFVSVLYSLKNNYSLVPISAVLGSNVFNFSLLLALVFWSNSVKISGTSREEDIWAQVFVAFIVFVNFLFIPSLHIVTLLLLLFIFIIYGYLVRKSFIRNQNERIFFDSSIIKKSSGVYFILGVLMTVFGSILLVESTLTLSMITGLGEGFISTILIGSFTSIPELLLFFYLVRKNNHSIAVSTITGSGVFNWIIVFALPAFLFGFKLDSSENIRCQFSSYFSALIGIYFYLLYSRKNQIKYSDSYVLILLYSLYALWNALC